MAKDPAFLFYSKDWIEGTAELMPEEKGVFIDLLAHQHQAGDLPNNTERLARIARLSHDEFLKIWEVLQAKFKANGNRLVNRKLSEVMSERSEKGHKNKVIGTLGSIIRLRGESEEIKKSIKKQFRVDDFLSISSEELSERLTEWYLNRLKCIGNGNAIEDINEEEDKGGMGEEETTSDADTAIVPRMFTIWKQYKPKYIFRMNDDFPSLSKICKIILKESGLSIYDKKSIEKVLETWEAIVQFIIKDKFYDSYQLSQIEKYFAAISSKFASSLEQPEVAKTGNKKPSLIVTNMNAAQEARELIKNKYSHIS